MRGETTTRSGGIYLTTSDDSQKAYFYIANSRALLGTATSHALSMLTAGAIRYEIDSSGNHNFQAGNITTTGTLSAGATTITGNATVSGKVLGTTASGYLDLYGDSEATSGVRVYDTGHVRMDGLPTADPIAAGELWNDVGTVKISAG